MRLNDAVNIEDLHQMAKRRLPKVMFDYIEGGVEDERGLARNSAAFHKHFLLPRYLVDVSQRDQSQTIFGRKFNSPFGISPTGGVGLYQRRGGELLLAEAAREANIPYIMSGGSNASMEEAARVAPHNTWFQMYAAKDPGVTDALVGRARDNGLGALVLTVDVPVHPKRERNFRNGFANVRSGGVLEAALKLKPSIVLDALTHPGWVYDYVRNGGAPTLGNWVPHAGNGASTADVIQFGRTQTPAAAQTWRDLERYRRLFPRTLIVKGILNPADAVRAAEIGVDGVIVSNHGGRQLDQAPASLDMLPAVKAAVGDLTVMLDSGVRRGADILIALCLGADFVFFGRPTLYGAVAGGLPGVKKAIDIFRGEIDLVMGQIGCPSLDQLGPDFLWRDDWPRNR